MGIGCGRGRALCGHRLQRLDLPRGSGLLRGRQEDLRKGAPQGRHVHRRHEKEVRRKGPRSEGDYDHRDDTFSSDSSRQAADWLHRSFQGGRCEEGGLRSSSQREGLRQRASGKLRRRRIQPRFPGQAGLQAPAGGVLMTASQDFVREMKIMLDNTKRELYIK